MKILRIAIALFSTTLLLTACKDKGGGSDGTDWATVALASQTATVGGVAVTLKVPEGLSKDDALSNDTRVSFKGKTGEPSVSLKHASIPAKDLDSAVNSAGFLFGKEAETLEQKERDDRFVVVLANAKKSKLLVAHYIKSGEASFECVVSQMTNDGVPTFDATVARFHEICDSVAVK